MAIVLGVAADLQDPLSPACQSGRDVGAEGGLTDAALSVYGDFFQIASLPDEGPEASGPVTASQYKTFGVGLQEGGPGRKEKGPKPR